MTINLGALRVELEAVGLTVVVSEHMALTATRNYGAGHVSDIHVNHDGRVRMAGYSQNGKSFADMPVDRRMFDALAVIARHLGHGPAPLTDGEIEVMAENVSESRAGSGRLDDVYERPNSLRNLRADIRAAIDALPERFGVRR